MDLQQIKATHYIGLVQIISDDFDYIRLCETHHGIQVNENLKEYEIDIISICDEISDNMFKLKQIITKSNTQTK